MRKVNALVATAGLALIPAATPAVSAIQQAESSNRQPRGMSQEARPLASPRAADALSRYLAYVGSIKSRLEIELDQYSDAMGISFQTEGRESFHRGDDAPSGLYYMARYRAGSAKKGPAVGLAFGELGSPDGQLATRCPAEYVPLQERLLAEGYRQMNLFDEIGRIESISFWRDDIELSVKTALIRTNGAGSPNVMCVEAIRMFG